MRLPLAKIYRAFPELDRFSDVECERYVMYAKGDIGCAFHLIPPLVIALLFAACVFVVFNAGPWFNVRLISANSEWSMFALVAGWISFVFGVPLIGGFLARDAVLHRLLRRYVRSRIERSRCPSCRYSLLGQRVNEGVIVCPECGGATSIPALGLESERDLLPPQADSEESAEASDT